MLTPHTTLRAIALETPAAIRVFERHQLDYCCGGRRTLAEACTEKHLDAHEVVQELEAVLAQSEAAPRDLTQDSASEVIGYILETHHSFERAELTRLLPLMKKVAEKHGPAHPEYIQLQWRFQQLNDELRNHFFKEEQVLFPFVLALDSALRSGETLPHACFATVESPIQQMLMEHEGAAVLIADIRSLTNGFTAPADACPTLVGLLYGLAEFERDLHRHMHLENNLLFPKAIALEQKAMAIA